MGCPGQGKRAVPAKVKKRKSWNYQDFRYYRYLGDQIHLVHDLNFGTPYYGTYFTQKKPLGPERFAWKKKESHRELGGLIAARGAWPTFTHPGLYYTVNAYPIICQVTDSRVP